MPDLEFGTDEQEKVITLREQQTQGTIHTEEGLASAPVSDRQRLIEAALPCLDGEAKNRGYSLRYLVLHVDG